MENHTFAVFSSACNADTYLANVYAICTFCCPVAIVMLNEYS